MRRFASAAAAALVRVTMRGGFAPEASRRDRLPQLSVFGDGRVIITGPTTLVRCAPRGQGGIPSI